ncbi:MAG: hypothetical protein AAAB35_26235 [Phyllobacterium sp.]|uniref:hypothetical protein n=1 Tax=Phyllobacterium sp. TaxID=1871046 RepID=UPI0030F0F8D5
MFTHGYAQTHATLIDYVLMDITFHGVPDQAPLAGSSQASLEVQNPGYVLN